MIRTFGMKEEEGELVNFGADLPCLAISSEHNSGVFLLQRMGDAVYSTWAGYRDGTYSSLGSTYRVDISVKWYHFDGSLTFKGGKE